jgi:hypothetical protein
LGEWTDNGLPDEAVDRDQLLANLTVYWLTGDGRLVGPAVRRGGAIRLTRPAGPLDRPVGVAVFPREIAPVIRRFDGRTNNIMHWTEFDRGGHFAAIEAPDLLVSDVRELFRRFR